MNENINLVEILKDCPKGTKLYTPLAGEVKFDDVFPERDDTPRVIVVTYNDGRGYLLFTKEGLYHDLPNGECLLFPSKDVRTWKGWRCPKPKKPKFDPKTLKAFDKVLAKMKYGMWYADFVSLPITELNSILCVMDDKDFDTIIPYNDDTKHLVGTADQAPEFYRYWEE